MHRRTLLRMRLVVSLFLALVLSVAVTAAAAATPESSLGDSGVLVQTFPMVLDCEHMTESAHAYAVEHHLCDSHIGDYGQVAPNNTTGGDCGTATLTLAQGSGSGNARFFEALSSTQGAIVRVHYTIVWNVNAGPYHSYSADPYNFSTTWTNYDYFNTGSGHVVGIMGGTVTLVWGGTCKIVDPWDAVDIV